MNEINTQELPTKRELEILRYIVNEHTSSEIAQITKLSIRTIETHRKHILKKTNSKTIVGLIKIAIEMGLLNNYFKREINI